MSLIPTGVLLERERERDTVREGLARARAQEGTLMLLEGPAGVGKTKLMREARTAAERAGMTALQARGSELEQPFAFGVVRQLLEGIVGELSGRAELFAGAAGPAARLFEPDGRSLPSGDLGFEALRSLYWLVVNLADQGPLLISLDDCQWADADSLRFIAYLAQRIEGLPVAMVLAGRPPDVGQAKAAALWAQLASRPSTIVLYPRPLSPAAAVALVRERLGAQADEQFCLACHTATGGNPLFLQELVRALNAAGVAPSSAAAGEVQAVGPAAVSRFVLHRLAALGPGASKLARVVAVLGDDQELQIAARVAGLSPEAAREAADELAGADIFTRGERVGFVHPIVRAALYENLAPGERQALHAAVADALAKAGAGSERITTHLLLTTPCGDPQRVQTLRSAAFGAARRGSPQAAAVRLRRALEESPTEQERAEMLAELGRYEIAATEFEAAEEHLRECLASGAALGTRATAASWLGRLVIVSGGRSPEAAIGALESLAEEIRPLDPERSLELGSELLMVTRHCRGLDDGLDLRESIARATATSGGAVVFAGSPVTIALVSLAVANIPLVTTMGFMAAIADIIAVLAAVTLLPAMLSIVGPHINSLRVRHPPTDAQAKKGAWAKWARDVASRPVIAGLLALAILIPLAIPLLSLNLGQKDVAALSTTTTARRAYDLISDNFGPGVNGPLLIAMSLGSSASGTSDPRLATPQKDVSSTKNVAAVTPAQLDKAGTTAYFNAISTAGPSEQTTTDLVNKLRSDVIPAAEKGTNMKSYVGGTTAGYIDLASNISSKLPLQILVVIGLSFMLLVLAFRTLIVPVQAAVMNVLSIGASYGVLTAIFQFGWLHSLIGLEGAVPIVSYVPLFMFAILFGLSMDYEVFLVSQIEEHVHEGEDNKSSVVSGLITSARVITAAATIMVFVFGGFVLNGDPTVKQFGVGLAVAVILDATIVRCLLVPALMVKMGKVNWSMPRWLDRLIPHISIEGAEFFRGREERPIEQEPEPEPEPTAA